MCCVSQRQDTDVDFTWQKGGFACQSLVKWLQVTSPVMTVVLWSRVHNPRYMKPLGTENKTAFCYNRFLNPNLCWDYRVISQIGDLWCVFWRDYSCSYVVVWGADTATTVNVGIKDGGTLRFCSVITLALCCSGIWVFSIFLYFFESAQTSLSAFIFFMTKITVYLLWSY